MAVETWVIWLLLAGNTSPAIAPGQPYTENSRLENLWIDGGWADGTSNPYSSGVYFPGAQIGGLRNVLISECGQRGHLGSGAYLVYENVWLTSHGTGPAFDMWNAHDCVINGLWAEFTNGAGSFLDGDGDIMAGTRFQFCQNILVTDWDCEGTGLGLKIAGCSNIVFNVAFFNGNTTVPPVGCLIKNLVYNGATSNGISFVRAQALECATAIVDTSTSIYTGQARNVTVPGAPSWFNTVNVSGTAVTATTGTPFTQVMVGLFPGVNGIFGPSIIAVIDSTHLTLSSSLGTLSGASFEVIPPNYTIQYSQDDYIANWISRLGIVLAKVDPADDAGVTLQGQPLRFQGSSSGTSTIQGVPPIGTTQSITAISNPNLGSVMLTVPANGYFSGQRVVVAGVSGQTSLDGEWIISIDNASSGTFTLQGAVGNGVASSSGTTSAPTDFLIKTQFDSIRIQGGNDVNPRGIVLQYGDTGTAISIDQSTGNTITITVGNKVIVNGGQKVSGSLEVVTGAVLDWLGGSGSRMLTVDNSGDVGAASIPSAGITQLTGPVTAGPGSGSQVSVITPTGVTAGSYGDATDVPVLTINSAGQVTAASTTPISGGAPGAWSSWSPSITPSGGALTISASAYAYVQFGKVVFVRAYLKFTISSTAASIQISLPVNPISLTPTYAQALGGGVTASGFAQLSMVVILSGSNAIGVFGAGGATFVSGTTYEILAEGSYQSV